MEKAQPRKLARRKAQLSPEEIKALTDQRHEASGTPTPQAADSAMKVIAKVVGTWIIGFLAIVSEHIQTVVLSKDNNYFETRYCTND